MEKRISHKDYYRPPAVFHYTGDIWRGLPTLGLLKQIHCSGLIITPACDLANNKVETISYLPILTVNEFFASRICYPIIRNLLLRLSNSVDGYAISDYFPKNRMPLPEEIKFLLAEFSILLDKKPSLKDIIDRLKLGLALVLDINNAEITTVNKQNLKKFLNESEYFKILTAVIRNSHASDLHFLPGTLENELWSVVPDHSVVLFRYPITAPIEIFEFANDSSCINWEAKMVELSTIFAIATQFKAEKPLKVGRLNETFLSDLLTRYSSLYLRIGSPDFDSDSISRITKEI